MMSVVLAANSCVPPLSPQIAWISDEKVARIVTAGFAYETVVEALLVHARGDFVQPPKQFVQPGGAAGEYERGTLIGMPAYVGGGFKALGAKLITGFPINVTRGIPRASGVIVLFDTTTGVPVAILDCRTISARGTAAIAAICVDRLGAKENLRVAVLGAGPMAHETVISLFVTRSRPIDSVQIFDPVGNRARAIVEAVSPFTDVPVELAPSARHCLADANVVIAATTGAKAYIEPDWLNDSWLIVALSSDDFVPETILSADKLICDDFVQNGQENMLFSRLVKSGAIGRDRLYGDLGQVVSGGVAGREDRERIFVNPTGMAIQDLAIAARVCAIEARANAA
jgi:ornithine cyclodeaminase